MLPLIQTISVKLVKMHTATNVLFIKTVYNTYYLTESYTLQSTTLIISQKVSHTLQSTTLIISQKVSHTLQS
jgi:hypothetical protein